MKKLLTLLMATILILSMATTAFATDYTVDSNSATSDTNYTSVSDALSDATDGDTVTISSTETLNDAAAIASGVTLEIEAGSTLTIASGATLTNGGIVDNNGTIIVNDEAGLKNALNADLSGTVQLGSDIELNSNWGNWEPIGTSTAPFTGTFDGNNKTISNLSVIGGDTSQYQGLFGYIDGATITNLTVGGTVSGGTNVGGIVGYAYNAFTIENCTNYVNVSGCEKVAGILGGTATSSTDISSDAKIKDCTNNGDITITATEEEQAAGIVGYAHTVTISNCTNNGTVTNASNYTAGIVAYTNTCTISGCTNTGAITGTTNVGGIVGMNKADTSTKSTIDDCTNTGVIGTTTTATSVGQIVGSDDNFNLGDTTANNSNGSTVEVYTGTTLTFADGTADKTTDCYTWVQDTATLTIIKDMNIEDNTGVTCLKFDCDSKLIINEGVTLTIYGEDIGIKATTLTIENKGTLNITSIDSSEGIKLSGELTYNGTDGEMSINTRNDACIYADGDVTLSGTVDMTSSDYYGIYVDGTEDVNDEITITINGNVTTNTYGAGITADEDLETLVIENNGTLTMNNGISAWDSTLSITGNGTLTTDYISADNITISDSAKVIANGEYGIESTNNITISDSAEVNTESNIWATNGDIEISDSAKVTANYIWANSGSITISGSAEVNASDICSYYENIAIEDTAIVNVSTSIYVGDANKTVTIDQTATLNALVSIFDYEENSISSFNDTIYGTVEVPSTDQAEKMFYAGTLAFMSDSKLTIDKDVEVFWSDYTITWDNANIVNNGVIYVPAGTYVDFTKITGDGYITIGDKTYDTDGETTLDSLELASSPADSNDYYTWTESVAGDGYDTLTLLKDMTIYEAGTDSGIELTNGGTIDLDGHTLTITTTSNTANGISTAGDLTITGTGTLNITSNGDGIVTSNNNLNIENATVNINADGTGINTNGASITLDNVTATIEAGSNGIDTSNGDITIEGDSDIDITSGGNGIYAYAETDGTNANITITDATVDITSSGKGIYAYVYYENETGNANITITDATVDITSSSHGIYAYVYYYNETGTNANITISGSANVNVKTTGAYSNGIEASGGDITISDSADVTVNAKGNGASGIQAQSKNITITTTGTVTIYAAYSGMNTNSMAGSITITDATVVNTSLSNIVTKEITIDDDATVSSTSKIALGDAIDHGIFTLADTATLNAVVAIDNGSTIGRTVYGNVVATNTYLGVELIHGVGTLDFAENSKLTINQGVAVSLVEYDEIK